MMKTREFLLLTSKLNDPALITDSPVPHCNPEEAWEDIKPLAPPRGELTQQKNPQEVTKKEQIPEKK